MIRCAALIIASDQDYTALEWKRTCAGKIDRARVEVLENSSHAGPLDQPANFNRLLLEFLHQ